MIRHDNFDIVDVAYKGKLIGATLILPNGNRVVKDFYCDFTTQTINIVFADATISEPASAFSFKSKFSILLDETYVPIKNVKQDKEK